MERTPSAPTTTPRWTEQRAQAWYAKQPWLCGFNYIPSNAINYTAMWDKTSFSPDLIQKELALAAGVGFNCVRVVLQHAVYADDPAYFRKTFGQFLAICQRNNIRVTDDELTRSIMERARKVPGNEQKVWDFYRNNRQALASLRAPIFEDKVIDFILELAKITDKTVPREELYKDDEA